MKQLFLAIAIATSSLTFSQTFHDVYIGGNTSSVINKFKAKGYSVQSKGDFWIKLTGNFGLETIELYVFSTLKTKQVFKVVAYLPEKSDWSDLRLQYEKYLTALTNKYGNPYESDFEFEDDEEDEMTQVKEERMSIYAVWLKPINNLNVAVAITKYQQISLTYENIKNIELRDKEQEEFKNINL